FWVLTSVPGLDRMPSAATGVEPWECDDGCHELPRRRPFPGPAPACRRHRRGGGRRRRARRALRVPPAGAPLAGHRHDARRRQRPVGPRAGAPACVALGGPSGFQPPLPASEDIDMIGGGVLDWQPGEWTDDTAMAIVVLEASLAASDGHDLRVETAQDHIARE